MDLSQGEWAGMQMDNARLYYARNRYYNPQLGRFISEDPIGLAGGINPYMYCGGDPVNYTDPLGLWQVNELVGSSLQSPQWQHDAAKFTTQSLPVVGAAAGTATRTAVMASVGTGAGLAASAPVVIPAGIFAIGDLATWGATGKSYGPFTALGTALGKKWFPMDLGNDAPSKVYQCMVNSRYKATQRVVFARVIQECLRRQMGVSSLLLPTRTGEYRRALKPAEVYGDGAIYDGHHTLIAYMLSGVDPLVIERPGTNRRQIFPWSVDMVNTNPEPSILDF